MSNNETCSGNETVYLDCDDPDWGASVSKFPWRETEGSFVMDAVCPRCKDYFQITVPKIITTLLPDPTLDIQETETQRCDCRCSHERPTGVKHGCGVRGPVANPNFAYFQANEKPDGGS
jgi:hypothetical protein